MEEILKSVRQASLKMSQLTSAQKNRALENLATLLEGQKSWLLEENKKDLEIQRNQLDSSLYQRLSLSESKIKDLHTGILDLQNLKDPIGERTLYRELDQGLILERRTTPIGVIGVIFESRPDAAIQIATLLLKSGNAGVLKGGKEAQNTLKAIEHLFVQLRKECEFLPDHWLSFFSSREEVKEMLAFEQYIDLIIPRGSNQLVQSVMQQTKIPVLGHADGICHIYLDKKFDLSSAISLIADSKAQYPSACNAVETLLIHQERFDEVIEALQSSHPEIVLIENPHSWSIEYGNLKLAVKSVQGVNEAVVHINRFGSHHTDVIFSDDSEISDQFVREVDSANVFVNCSTRFADGFRYGFGAEVGISTNKTHARGPVGLDGLTIYKYILRGSGQLVSDYVGKSAKSFSHRDLS